MPTLTRQIIKDIVSEEVKSSIFPLQLQINTLDQKVNTLDQKIDTVITQLTDIAGQFKRFD